MRRAILILADGARADLTADYLERLPNLRRLAERGGQKKLVSVWPSVTGPAHIPLLSGVHPGEANIPGLRWFDRERQVGRRRASKGLRSYCGIGNRHFSADAGVETTLFSQSERPLSVLEMFNRGLSGSSASLALQTRLAWAHFNGRYAAADRQLSNQALSGFIKENPDFTFLLLPGIDGHSHGYGPDSKEVFSSYRDLDRSVGAFLKASDRQGGETLLLVSSDHGHTRVREHIDIDDLLVERGLRTACHLRRLLTRDPEAVVAVSGNAMAHIYVRRQNASWREISDSNSLAREQPGLIERLVAEPAVDIVVVRDRVGQLLIHSRRGRARLSVEEAGASISYLSEAGADPFGYPELPEKMNSTEALELSFETNYPDALWQILRLAESRRCGDIIVSATPGYDFRDRNEKVRHASGHGALYHEQMLVPLISSEPIVPGPGRSADVYATIVDWMGWDPAAASSGRSLLQ